MPPAGDPFLWRLSVAEIGAAGPFSDFTGYRRILVLLEGEGVLLDFADGSRAALRSVGEMLEFDGALAAECHLLGGPCRDLNLMLANTLPPARVQIGRVTAPLTLATGAQEWLLLFCIEGRARVACDGTGEILEAGDLAATCGGAVQGAGAGAVGPVPGLHAVSGLPGFAPAQGSALRSTRSLGRDLVDDCRRGAAQHRARPRSSFPA